MALKNSPRKQKNTARNNRMKGFQAPTQMILNLKTLSEDLWEEANKNRSLSFIKSLRQTARKEARS